MSTFRKRKFNEEGPTILRQKKIATDKNVHDKSNTMIYLRAIHEINYKINQIENKITILNDKIETQLRNNRRVEKNLMPWIKINRCI